MKHENIFNIRETAETLVPDRTARISYLWALGILTLMVSIITLGLTKMPNQIPLYFTLPWGEARLTNKMMLYLIPGLTLGFLIINLSVARLLRHLSPLLPRVLAVSTVVIAGMMLIALYGVAQSLIL